jgi:hypothetical protein
MSWLTTYPSKKSITNLLASRISFLLSLPLILGTIGCGGDDPVTTDESAEKNLQPKLILLTLPMVIWTRA